MNTVCWTFMFRHIGALDNEFSSSWVRFNYHFFHCILVTLHGTLEWFQLETFARVKELLISSSGLRWNEYSNHFNCADSVRWVSCLVYQCSREIISHMSVSENGVILDWYCQLIFLNKSYNLIEWTHTTLMYVI